ncbi:hypothetical protein [Lederbergia panacisoli]|uniref:hypothetical protein n=1 Tax=Lederbergia panacisoli TaxID=1255251 RepID=UPI00214B899C|nr:hypothetical protein [Lederbergia panacisoli]MCR2822758.1 hypothetical protein [Lederbergia panacisoli]
MRGFSKKSAALGAITGGGLLAINIIWQGYLDLTLGGDSFLHDVTHFAYYLNTAMIFFAMCGLLIGLFSLHNHIKATKVNFLWRTGIFLSGLGQGLFGLGALAFFVHGFLDLGSLHETVDLVAGISSIVMFLGALPLGIFLIRIKTFPRFGTILFLLTVPVVAVATTVIYNVNALIGGILFGGIYGLAWIITGFYLRK